MHKNRAKVYPRYTAWVGIKYCSALGCGVVRRGCQPLVSGMPIRQGRGQGVGTVGGTAPLGGWAKCRATTRGWDTPLHYPTKPPQIAKV